MNWMNLFSKKKHKAKIPIYKMPDELSVDSSKEQIPTFYVHGFRGGAHTTKDMVASAQKATQSPVFLRATVDWASKIHYSGYWSTAKSPIIQIVLKDRWIPTGQIETWFNLILTDLHQRYEFKSYNAVGHSLGSVAMVSYLIKNFNKPYQPDINHLSLVAGPFDGVVALGDMPNVNPLTPEGRPAFMTPKYIWMYLNRYKFPKNAQVLNVFGNIGDYSNTDQYVSVSSARSIKFILKPIVKVFMEYNAKGANGEHSMMHDNKKVLHIIDEFNYFNKTVKQP